VVTSRQPVDLSNLTRFRGWVTPKRFIAETNGLLTL
jgi:hypothetical protein